MVLLALLLIHIYIRILIHHRRVISRIARIVIVIRKKVVARGGELLRCVRLAGCIRRECRLENVA